MHYALRITTHIYLKCRVYAIAICYMRNVYIFMTCIYNPINNLYIAYIVYSIYVSSIYIVYEPNPNLSFLIYFSIIHIDTPTFDLVRGAL